MPHPSEGQHAAKYFYDTGLRKAWSTKIHTGVEVNHIWLMDFYEFQNEKQNRF